MAGDSHRPPRSGCAINAAIEVLGDPWSMLVLRDVIFGNRRYFRELLQGSQEVSSPTSSAASSSGSSRRACSPGGGDTWTAGGIVADRSRHPGPAGHGREGNWGLAHRDAIRELRVRAELLRDGSHVLIERFMDELGVLSLGIPLLGPRPAPGRAGSCRRRTKPRRPATLISSRGT